MQVVPYKEEDKSKKEQVADMFNNISPKYDLLNHTLSLGVDILWRKKAVRLLKPYAPKSILDIATGTGDFAVETSNLKPDEIIGVDISEGMLDVGRQKMVKKKLDGLITMEVGDSENLRFEDNKFDVVTVAFGVRNFENLKKGLREMFRVTSPGGHVMIIEFSKPGRFPVKQLYNFYFRAILPKIGKLVSKDNAAYQYLPDSVAAFPDGENFLEILNEVGYKEAKCIPLTFGISSIYWARK
jgi:demethylmenaquinone methyltransferase/2-methoxy-6-polyprenyl-1,4-benzoquinol methylase